MRDGRQSGLAAAAPETLRRAQTPRAARTDIQALRAIAVLCVLGNHLWPARLAGGYVGVDVFFVVSGFLISLHLVKELDSTGSVKLGRFYARRVRRLIPAAYTVALFGLLGTVLWLPVARWADEAGETFAASAYFENWLLAAKSVDYSAHDAAATTVQHYWSLSVEEQFYLVWPVLLIVCFAIARRRGWSHRRVAGIALGVVGLLSFGGAWTLTEANRSSAYFVTHTRVWEFAIGSLLALAVSSIGDRLEHRYALRAAMQWVGLAGIVVAALLFDEETSFPGPWAALPVLGTALVIAAGPVPPRNTPMRLLAWRPVQFIGDISYSLYLWHWPLIVLTPFVLHRDLGLPDKLAILAASILLAWLTKRYIEDPGRKRLLPNLSSPKFFAVLAASLVVMLGLCAAVTWIGQARGDAAKQELDSRKTSACFGAAALDPDADCGDPYAATDVITSGDAEAPWIDGTDCQSFEKTDGVSSRAECDFSRDGEQAKKVWLVGDSHSEHWSPAILEIARQQGWDLTMDFWGGCPVVDVPRSAPSTPSEGQPCYEWAKERVDRIAEAHPDLIITSTFSSTEEIDDGTGRSQPEQYLDAVSRLADRWLGDGTQLVAIRDVPRTLDRATSECLLQHLSAPLDCSNSRDEAVPADPYSDAFTALGREDVSTVDMTDQFCDEQRCYGLIGGVAVYFDDDHLSKSYGESLAPELARRLGTPLTE